ncbi:GntR family transcriptional regulator [Flavimaricola marinus]|uniref:Putative HTH-type transcriptional regulator YdfH n=1 Tax=Flavimaricola marinus TaxID=1819565 RepID=A0A238LM34_9RHOB|nr:GntR family transcriptional regulator [Flavimaricola marinus]SMY09910.1 putative HTH-type transcriptional regulator YdfH [Flavimaricola marinus]
MPPLDRFEGSLATRTYLSLRQAILDLTYKPGELLRKGEICEALGVSRSPVSEAIARLASEGLVHVVPQAGTFVARFSMNEIREGAFLREAIEVAAIRRIAPEISEEQLVLLRRNLRVQEATIADGDAAAFYDHDAEFHQLLLSFTGFPKVGTVAETAWVQVNRARRQTLPIEGRLAETLAEHHAVLKALEARDPDAAAEALSAHLRQLLTFLVPLERTRPDLFDPD